MPQQLDLAALRAYADQQLADRQLKSVTGLVNMIPGPSGKVSRFARLINNEEYDEARIDEFIYLAKTLTDEEYWRGLSYLWTNARISGYQGPRWMELFRSPRLGRKFLMKEEERKYLAAMPDKFWLYRGATEEGRRGLSWTRDLDVATNYCKHRGGSVWTCETTKDGVFAFLDRHRLRQCGHDHDLPIFLADLDAEEYKAPR